MQVFKFIFALSLLARPLAGLPASGVDIKSEAAAVLKAMGLTVSDAFRLMMVKIAKEKARRGLYP